MTLFQTHIENELKVTRLEYKMEYYCLQCSFNLDTISILKPTSRSFLTFCELRNDIEAAMQALICWKSKIEIVPHWHFKIFPKTSNNVTWTMTPFFPMDIFERIHPSQSSI